MQKDTISQSVLPDSHRQGLRTWIEVDRDAMRQNYRAVRGVISGRCQLMAVAKSNAYGHGLCEYAMAMQEFGADWIGVDSITEAMALRKAGVILPILVLGYTLPERFGDALLYDIRLTVSSLDGLRLLRKFIGPSPAPLIHIKVDTGMHRQGFMPAEIPEVIAFMKSAFSNAELVDGIYTHFAAAKNPAFPQDTFDQIKHFRQIKELFASAGFRVRAHAAATSGSFLFPQSHFDMVRVGIGLHGLWPSIETKHAATHRVSLRPTLSWRTIVSEIKHVSAGSRVGYDFTETLSKDSVVAVCPIGYWHGYPRILSGIGHVIVRGVRCRVLGRVSMDMLTIDVSDIAGMKMGDIVTLLGGDGAEDISADELGRLAETTNYEIVTRLNPLMKRIYHS